MIDTDLIRKSFKLGKYSDPKYHSTHYEDCHLYSGHHFCTIAKLCDEVDSLREVIKDRDATIEDLMKDKEWKW